MFRESIFSWTFDTEVIDQPYCVLNYQSSKSRKMVDTDTYDPDQDGLGQLLLRCPVNAYGVEPGRSPIVDCG